MRSGVNSHFLHSPAAYKESFALVSLVCHCKLSRSGSFAVVDNEIQIVDPSNVRYVMSVATWKELES